MEEKRAARLKIKLSQCQNGNSNKDSRKKVAILYVIFEANTPTKFMFMLGPNLVCLCSVYFNKYDDDHDDDDATWMPIGL